MKILHGIWSEDGKYATHDSIQRCWRKAAILPVSWGIEINQDVGSASMMAKDKMISKADCDYLCGLMGKLSMNVKETNMDTGTLAYRLSDIDDKGNHPQSVKDLILRRWQYYYELEPVFRHRPNFEALLMFFSQDPNKNDDGEGTLLDDANDELDDDGDDDGNKDGALLMMLLKKKSEVDERLSSAH